MTREGEEVGRPDSKGCGERVGGRERESASETALSRDLAVKLKRGERMGNEIHSHKKDLRCKGEFHIFVSQETTFSHRNR